MSDVVNTVMSVARRAPREEAEVSRSTAILSMRSRLAAFCGAAMLLTGAVLGTGATAAQATVVTQIDLVGPPGSQSFGESDYVYNLPNGNYVLVDPGFDHGKVPDVGAVYLYDGTTDALISTITGTIAGSQVGEYGLTLLTSAGSPGSNFLITSPHWASTAIGEAQGAVTWVNGTTGQTATGVNSTVTAANSLVGSSPSDNVGYAGPSVLANGNYVVMSPHWDNGATVDAGAVTWGAGATGTVGVVSAGNSLVGGSATDLVGGTYLLALPNGNYVVFSPNWANGAALEAGAVTWGNGAAGVKGLVSAANSLVGSGPNDQVGSHYGLSLTNGNYVVLSPLWDGAGTNLGAATWGNGTTGSTVGVVSAANSLVGSGNLDGIGGYGVNLSNGNYVITSPFWDKGGVPNAGAVTWGSGTSGVKGPATVGNSLVGFTANDQLGSEGVVALSNGNYAIASSLVDGVAVDTGAVTWGNGQVGSTGSVSAFNSLVGSTAGDRVGADGIAALSNGNYVVRSRLWDGVATDTGAVTWRKGTGPNAAVVSVANSLVGSTAGDQVGSSSVWTLPNGNYVVGSSLWDGAATNVGAVTFGSGTAGVNGAVSVANSLIGSTSHDAVGSTGITILSNGNYVVRSQLWDRGGAADVGAVTWGSGTDGVAGLVSITNSLVGSTAGDQVGSSGVTPLMNGNYLVSSVFWDNGAIADAGAATWGHGAFGIAGAVSAAQSLVGSSANDHVGWGALANPDGSYIVQSIDWDHGSAVDTGAATYGPATGVVGVITASNSAFGTPASKAGGFVISIHTGRYLVSTSANRAILMQTSTGVDFIPLPPARLADTRSGGATVDGLFAAGDARPPDSTLVLAVGGRGGVPANASAVSLNVTAVSATGDGFLTVFPCGSPLPNASNLNFTTGATVANGVVAKLGTNGEVCIFVSAGTHLIVDVNGAFPWTTTLISSNPARVIDTRPLGATADGLQQEGGLRVAGSSTAVPIAGRAGVPANASAVVLNVTVTGTQAPGFLTVYPCGGAVPTASNLNYGTGATVANLVLTKLGAGGAVCIFNQSVTHLIIDVTGFFPSGSSYTAASSARRWEGRIATHPTRHGTELGRAGRFT